MRYAETKARFLAISSPSATAGSDTPQRAVTGDPNQAGQTSPGCLVADGEDEIHLRGPGAGELLPPLAAEAFRFVFERFQ